MNFEGVFVFNIQFIEFIMPLKFIKSTKNKKQFYHEGYLYNKKGNNKNSVTWRCVSYHCDTQCPAIIHTDNEKSTGNKKF